MNEIEKNKKILKRQLIEVNNLKKQFSIGRLKVNALDGVSLQVLKGEFVALQGASGAGKSTLLHLIGGLEQPTAGKIIINRKNLQNMNEEQLTLFRKDNIGFVFQFFNLIPSLTAVENVVVSRMFEPIEDDDGIWDYAHKLLEGMGLKNRLDHRPSELSGGEQQRVAIARALLNKPKILLADEPTGNIDTKAGIQIMKLFREQNSRGTTVIVATHDNEIARFAGRIIQMKDGKLI